MGAPVCRGSAGLLTLCANSAAEAVLAFLLASASEYLFGLPKLDFFRGQTSVITMIAAVLFDKDIQCEGCRDNANGKQSLHSDCSGI